MYNRGKEGWCRQGPTKGQFFEIAEGTLRGSAAKGEVSWGISQKQSPGQTLKDPTHQAEFRLCSMGIGKPMRLSYSTLKVESASRNERSSEQTNKPDQTRGQTRAVPSPFHVLRLLARECLGLKIQNRRPPGQAAGSSGRAFLLLSSPRGTGVSPICQKHLTYNTGPPASGWTDLSVETQAHEERQKSRERTFVGRGAPPFRADTCCCREGRKEQEGAVGPDKKEAQPLIPRG